MGIMVSVGVYTQWVSVITHHSSGGGELAMGIVVSVGLVL